MGTADGPKDVHAGDGAQAPLTPSTLPFPESLCHRCGAPPRYVKSARSTFILCPVLPNKYPPQPVVSCPVFIERAKE